MPVLIVAVGAAMVAFLAFAAWQGRLVSRALQSHRCPSCGEPLTPLTPGPGTPAEDPHPRSYEVACCPGCATVVTSVHGTRSAYAYCPSCRQLSLALTADALGRAVNGAVPTVRVEEHCQICGHTGAAQLGGDMDTTDGHEDNVIPFPGRHG